MNDNTETWYWVFPANQSRPVAAYRHADLAIFYPVAGGEIVASPVTYPNGPQ